MIRGMGLVAAGVLLASFSSGALAAPVTYTFTATGPITGTLGSTQIGGVGEELTFTFTGDTSNVQSFSSPINGHEILVGTGSCQFGCFKVTDISSGATVASGTFNQADNIFVAIDNQNGGVGFGSASTPFPGNPAYPLGVPISPTDPNISYDLKSDKTISSANALSCLGFPFTCNTPTPLGTSAGDLVLGVAGAIPPALLPGGTPPFAPVDSGTFTAVVGTPVTTPEPASLGLLALGVAGLGFMRRRSGA